MVLLNTFYRAPLFPRPVLVNFGVTPYLNGPTPSGLTVPVPPKDPEHSKGEVLMV